MLHPSRQQCLTPPAGRSVQFATRNVHILKVRTEIIADSLILVLLLQFEVTVHSISIYFALGRNSLITEVLIKFRQAAIQPQ